MIEGEIAMVTRRNMLFRTGGTLLTSGLLAALGWRSTAKAAAAEKYEIMHTDAEWKQRLNPTQYAILRQEGTERPFSSPLDHEKRAGTFSCAGCDLPAYSSKTKFDSGTGWPSFWQPLPNAIATRTDSTLGMSRTEVHCRRCGGHLGHVFDDGPKPTGLRYCMNGAVLKFAPEV
jgi:peptide-methionine (R)-S-oxide reductase